MTVVESPRGMSSLGLIVVTAISAGLGCGSRTGLLEDEGGSSTGVMGVDPREGGCDNPHVLPFANQPLIRGRVLGPSRVEGWCGDGENDAGPEDSYLISPTFDTDVILLFLEETDFTPSLRVTRDGCYTDEENLPRVCAAPVGDFPFWHFLAEAGHEYTVTVDSPAETDGKYAMQVFYGPPDISGCPVHSMQITQTPGGYFTWSNDLGGRGGRVDGHCGGPGAENMFQVNVSYPGNITFQVRADDSFAPVVSLRTGCGGSTELTCSSMEEQGSSTFAVSWFFEPGTYFVVIDQNDVKGGHYMLEVFSD